MAQKIVIDSDAGVDDAVAILLTLSVKDANLLAVTCVHGNTSLDNVTRNVQRILKLCKREDIPVFRGSATNLMGTNDHIASYYHGEDGLGSVPDNDPPDPSTVQSEHAVNALIRLSKEHKGQITLCPIGPLTNIALAMRMDPDFTKRLKKIVVMGGNITGKGCKPPAFGSEFNFYCDPEAAHIVLQQAECPVVVIPFETCYLEETGVPWDWYDKWISHNNAVSKFVGAIMAHTCNLERYEQKMERFFTCDPVALAVALRPQLSTGSRVGQLQVERNGTLTRGQMVEMSETWTREKTPGPEIEVVTKIDTELFKTLMGDIMKL